MKKHKGAVSKGTASKGTASKGAVKGILRNALLWVGRLLQTSQTLQTLQTLQTKYREVTMTL